MSTQSQFAPASGLGTPACAAGFSWMRHSEGLLRLFVFNGLKLLALGLIIGLPMAFALALSSLLYGVSSDDLVSVFDGTMLLASVVVLVCYIPARAATRVDPIIALRYE